MYLMDPNACLFWLLDSANRGDAENVKEYADSLRDWLNSGGFCPLVYWNGAPCDVVLVYDYETLCVRTRQGTLRAVPMSQLLAQLPSEA